MNYAISNRSRGSGSLHRSEALSLTPVQSYNTSPISAYHHCCPHYQFPDKSDLIQTNAELLLSIHNFYIKITIFYSINIDYCTDFINFALDTQHQLPTSKDMNLTKTQSSIFIIISSVLLLFSICACSSHSGKEYRIGVSQCSGDYWREKTNEDLRFELLNHPEVTLDIRSADNDSQKQVEDIADFISKGYDLIILSPNEADPAVDIVREALNKGIPVVTFDRRLNSDDFTAHMEVDNYQLGEGVFRYARSLRKGDLNVIEVKGPASASPAVLRHQGFTDAAAKDPSVNILASVDGKWDDGRTSLLIDSLLNIYPDMDVIYAHTDHMALGASRTLKKRGREDVAVIGIDGFPEIGVKGVSEGNLTATFLYPTEGERLLKIALAILNGEPYERITTVAPLSPIDSSNADILIAQEKLLNQETDKIKLLNGKVDEYLDLYTTQKMLLISAGIILILMGAALFLLLRNIHLTRSHRNELLAKNSQLEEEKEKQRKLYEQLSEATKSKLMFFTNVSHDLRTPLTLIAGPVDKVAADHNLTPENSRLMLLVKKNVNILRRLIDQILDFRKYESGKVDLQLAETDFPHLLREWAEAFSDVARLHDIRLILDIPAGQPDLMAIDPEKMERVFFNLMSNAFKHTPDNGRITVSYRHDKDTVEYSVTDTGCGISTDEVERIFEQFYQAGNANPKGSGIGLALTKAFVELHGGKIEVSSEKGKGSSFKVTLPVRHCNKELADSTPRITREAIDTELAVVAPAYEANSDEKPTLLVIDDNRDIQALVDAELGNTYNILTASDGLQGLKMATKYVPDIILCDVMMPVMDGMECVKRLKEEISTSHIPVLMLTACAMDSQRVEGYDSGADAYMSKPFSLDVLAARCRNLLAGRKRIKEIYGTSLPAKISSKQSTGKKDRESNIEKSKSVSKPAIRPNDVESDFYSRFVQLVNERISNPDLKIDELAAEMGLGQSQFTRKIKALTNYTPVELIRSIRLQRARTLLMSTEKTVSEIAYDVGFTSLAYFSRCYKEAFGTTPTDTREK